MSDAADGRASLRADLEALFSEDDFSGVVAVRADSTNSLTLARGLADRANGRLINGATRFGIASVTKGLTALTVASLVETGELTFETPLRSLAGDALPTVDPAVTIEHLLRHTSGVGDYLDEEALDDVDAYVMPIPVHRLAAPLDYLAVVAGCPQRAQPGTEFRYNTGAYVMLSIAVELVTGRSFYDLVDERVLRPAGMEETAFVRSDPLPADTALGYLADGRSNVLHLPVRGAGDGGAYSTVGDLGRLWDALLAGRVVSATLVERILQPGAGPQPQKRGYGLGFWLAAAGDIVILQGMDAGVSAQTAVSRRTGRSFAVIANTSDGTWPLARRLEAWLAADDQPGG
jgi:CubicO group peptidase (beta-lactamase class C family)